MKVTFGKWEQGKYGFEYLYLGPNICITVGYADNGTYLYDFLGKKRTDFKTVQEAKTEVVKIARTTFSNALKFLADSQSGTD